MLKAKIWDIEVQARKNKSATEKVLIIELYRGKNCIADWWLRDYKSLRISKLKRYYLISIGDGYNDYVIRAEKMEDLRK